MGSAHRQAGRAGALGMNVEVRLVGGPGVAGLGQQLPGHDAGTGPHPGSPQRTEYIAR